MKHYSPSALARLVAPPLIGETDMLAMIRRELDGTLPGKARLARRLGIPEAKLSRILRGQIAVPDAVAAKIGFRRVVRFERVAPGTPHANPAPLATPVERIE